MRACNLSLPRNRSREAEFVDPGVERVENVSTPWFVVPIPHRLAVQLYTPRLLETIEPIRQTNATIGLESFCRSWRERRYVREIEVVALIV